MNSFLYNCLTIDS